MQTKGQSHISDRDFRDFLADTDLRALMQRVREPAAQDIHL